MTETTSQRLSAWNENQAIALDMSRDAWMRHEALAVMCNNLPKYLALCNELTARLNVAEGALLFYADCDECTRITLHDHSEEPFVEHDDGMRARRVLPMLDLTKPFTGE